MHDRAGTNATRLADRMERIRRLRLDAMVIGDVDIREASDQNGLPLIALASTPDVCRVQFTLHPSADSRIGVELWLPIDAWNGCFLGTGNGGQGGQVSPVGLIHGASLGFATANTDLGTTVDPTAMIGSIERIRDFGGRATHLMTKYSKILIAEFYGREAEKAYFIGSSTGGQQALRLAQAYPEDYDGIVAICPANNRVRLHTSFVWNWQALTVDGGAVISPDEAAVVMERLVAEYGDAAGCAPGDAFLPYPDQIDIDWSLFDDVLTLPQRAALTRVFEGPIDPTTGERIFGRYSMGGELGDWYTSDEGRARLQELNFPFTWLWGSSFDPLTFDFHDDYLRAVSELEELLDARSPDLSAFRARGGKLILLTGTADSIIPFHDTVEYFEKMLRAMGGAAAVDEFCRFFVVPGLGHGFGGPGPQDVGGIGLASTPDDAEHSVLLALTDWVERGHAPERLLAVRFNDGVLGSDVVAERPVYPFPLRTRYVDGDPNRADSYHAHPA